jgi:hypothetical protein
VKVKIDRIRIDMGTQTRCALDNDHVNDLHEAIEAGAELPPVIVFDDDENLIMARGFHRYAAYMASKVEEVDAVVKKGTVADALLFNASEDTSDSPLRRTREDKRNAVKMLLAMPQWSDKSDNWIAEQCRVSDYLVSNVRTSLNGSTSQLGSSSNGATSTGKDGKKRPRKRAEKGAKTPKPCKRCLRVGSPTCAKCKENFPKGFPKPGEEAKAPETKPGRSKQGKPVYDWKKWEGLLGPVIREYRVITKAYKDESPEGSRVSKALDTLAETSKAWKERLVKG